MWWRGWEPCRRRTCALVADKLPGTQPLSREESLALLARKYFRSHGPATLEDFAWWCGLGLNDCRQGMAAIGPELIRDGEVIGNWNTSVGPVAVDIFHPDASLDEAALGNEIERYSRFFRG